MSDTVNRPRLSVCLITRNEAHHVQRCLQSVAFADEWLVLDSGSEDNTVALARAMGAQVSVRHDWPGFGPQKNRVVDEARGDWVFSIDADEWVSDELARAIQAVVVAEQRPFAAYWIDRRSRFCGRLIRFGDWGGDRVLRLFVRGQARFSDDVVHERVLAPEPHGHLQGYLWHDSVESLADAREKMIRYALAGASKLRARERGAGPLMAALRGGWTFFRGYVLRGGFLDGREGWQIARFNARGTRLRYRWAGKSEDHAAHEAELELRR